MPRVYFVLILVQYIVLALTIVLLQGKRMHIFSEELK